jgi:hypothetical protein
MLLYLVLLEVLLAQEAVGDHPAGKRSKAAQDARRLLHAAGPSVARGSKQVAGADEAQ